MKLRRNQGGTEIQWTPTSKAPPPVANSKQPPGPTKRTLRAIQGSDAPFNMSANMCVKAGMTQRPKIHQMTKCAPPRTQPVALVEIIAPSRLTEVIDRRRHRRSNFNGVPVLSQIHDDKIRSPSENASFAGCSIPLRAWRSVRHQARHGVSKYKLPPMRCQDWRLSEAT